MNPIEQYYVRQYGSEKGYLFLLMQLALIAGLLISIFAVFIRENSYMFLQVIPIFMLVLSLTKFNKKFRSEFTTYAAFFIVFFFLVTIAPFALRILTISTNPLEMIKYSLYLVLAVLIVYVIFKLYLSRKTVTGVVLMADRGEVVVQVDFDLLSGIRAGKYVVETKGRKLRKGQTVKVLIKGGLFTRPTPYKLA